MFKHMTDALKTLAYAFKGRRHDMGDKLISFASHSGIRAATGKLRDGFLDYLEKIVQENKECRTN